MFSLLRMNPSQHGVTKSHESMISVCDCCVLIVFHCGGESRHGKAGRRLEVKGGNELSSGGLKWLNFMNLSAGNESKSKL